MSTVKQVILQSLAPSRDVMRRALYDVLPQNSSLLIGKYQTDLNQDIYYLLVLFKTRRVKINKENMRNVLEDIKEI